jgi:hypothetical protein
MKLRLEHGLLFADAQLVYHGKTLLLRNVILDTGSAGTLFSADHLLSLGLQYEPNDRVHRIHGVGGSEFVFTKHVEALSVSTLSLADFEIEVGAMEYGFDIDGIIGMDFLVSVGAVIDLSALQLRAAS